MEPLITIVLILLGLFLFGSIFKNPGGTVVGGIGNGCAFIIIVGIIIAGIAYMISSNSTTSYTTPPVQETKEPEPEYKSDPMSDFWYHLFVH